MKKCVFLITNMDQGGIETYLLRFLHSNPNSFYSIVLCKSGKYGDLFNDYEKVADELRKDGIGFFSLVAYLNFYRYLLTNDVDTVCDFTGNFAGIPLFIAKLVGVKKRIAFYRGSTNHFKETPFRLLYNTFVKNLVSYSATKILSNSNAALDFFFPKRDLRSEKYGVVYNGLDINSVSCNSKDNLRNEFHIPTSSFVVGHSGRCNAAKNHDTIIKVAVNLCCKYQDVHFVLVGKGVEEKYISIIQQNKLENKIHVLGYRNDVMRLLPLFDLYYFPSITEGQPNALIEAMVTGVPIIASNIAPIRESVPSDMYELLVPPCDVKKAVEEIENIYLKRTDHEAYRCTEWARKHFDANVLFEKFRKEL